MLFQPHNLNFYNKKTVPIFFLGLCTNIKKKMGGGEKKKDSLDQ